MRKGLWIGAALAAAAGTGAAWSQEPKEPPPPGADMMKKWMEFATPGKPHELLEGMIGTWDITTSVTMTPGAAPVEEKGEVVNRWVLGKRFVESRMTGTMFGMPAEGTSLFGYDNFRRRYVATFASSLGTSIHRSEGGTDRTGKAIVLWGTLDEFLDGTVGKPVTHVFRFDGPDEMTMEVHDPEIGAPNTLVVRTRCRRRK